jgi:heat shock protein HtpX
MYSEIASNKRKTVLIMFVFVLFIGLLGWLFSWYTGEPAVTPYILIAASLYALFMYYSGSRLSLSVSGAHQIAKKDNPRLYKIVENLAITEGLPTPKIYVIEDKALNAFATGRKPSQSSVAVTTGLLDSLNDHELQGVMAHELGHIKNYDMRVSMVAFAMVAVIGLLADIMLRMSWYSSRDNDSDSNSNQLFFILGLVAAILAPLIATMIQLAISRKREYLADATGALTTRYPEGLASALQKIKHSSSVVKRQNTSTAHFFFANPLKGKGIANLFSTHPPIDDRIKRLHDMGRKA